jgi:alpha-galactosidase
MRKLPKQLLGQDSAVIYSAFFLCASVPWLIRSLSRMSGSGEYSKEIMEMPQGNKMAGERTAVAIQMTEPPDAEGFPSLPSWEAASSLRFDADWQGKNADRQRDTEVRLLWTPESLYLRFRARYRVITIFPEAEANGRRDQLWDRDVAEVFLQPDPSQLRRYMEFEVSPNGFWIDLDIAPGEKHDLKSGLRRRVILNKAAKTWVAELALPMNSLVERFDPEAKWKVNFYRVEGAEEPRFYSAWRPTRTPEPNFHVPEAFGELVFVASPLPRG